MKRFICVMMALLLALGVCAAEEYTGYMRIVNCKEWVSLRQNTSTSSARLDKVPAGAIVWCHGEAGNGFVYTEYNGKSGYVMSDYLAPLTTEESVSHAMDSRLMSIDELIGSDRVVFNDDIGEYTIIAARGYDEGECLRVGCFKNGSPVWGRVIDGGVVTELDGTAVFIAGTVNEPRVMVYSSLIGLASLYPTDGTVMWLLPVSEITLGASLTTAVDSEGTMYIAGYYGPDPVAVNFDGEVLWQSDCTDNEIYWPGVIMLEDESVVVRYYSSNDIYSAWEVCYSRATGEKMWAKGLQDKDL